MPGQHDAATLREAHTQLSIDCDANVWKVHPLCVEEGCATCAHGGQASKWMCKVYAASGRTERTSKVR